MTTGAGSVKITAIFAGSINGSARGEADMTLVGTTNNGGAVFSGTFTIKNGSGGLAGVEGRGTWTFNRGLGGTYRGQVEFDDE